MFSALQNAMLCVNCFRDLPGDVRAQCVDIDTAHAQASKRLERGQNAIMDLQVKIQYIMDINQWKYLQFKYLNGLFMYLG